MSVGIDRQLESIPHAELSEDRRQVVTHGGFANAEMISDGLIFHPLSDQLDDLALASGEGLDLDVLGVG